MGIGDWGLGIGCWADWPIHHTEYVMPKPQNLHSVLNLHNHILFFLN